MDLRRVGLIMTAVAGACFLAALATAVFWEPDCSGPARLVCESEAQQTQGILLLAFFGLGFLFVIVGFALVFLAPKKETALAAEKGPDKPEGLRDRGARDIAPTPEKQAPGQANPQPEQTRKAPGAGNPQQEAPTAPRNEKPRPEPSGGLRQRRR